MRFILQSSLRIIKHPLQNFYFYSKSYQQVVYMLTILFTQCLYSYIRFFSHMEELGYSTFTQQTRICDQSQQLNNHRSKLLPHIRQQYQFRITNRLLIQKITNPRRDKLIIQSLAHAKSKQLIKNKKGSAPTQNTFVHRRKMIGQRKFTHDTAVQVDASEEEELLSRTTAHHQGIIRSQVSKWKKATELLGQLNQTCHNMQSKNQESVGTKFRNNFVGKIIKNYRNNTFNQQIQDSTCLQIYNKDALSKQQIQITKNIDRLKTYHCGRQKQNTPSFPE